MYFFKFYTDLILTIFGPSNIIFFCSLSNYYFVSINRNVQAALDIITVPLVF
jgi:hypothetical protein